MCGIVGSASTEGHKNRHARLLFMKMGLDIDSWRGWESTGLALVPKDTKEETLIYKRALNGRDFIQLKKVDKYLDDMEKYSVAIGHNRAATTGRGNIVDHNAHPFQYGDITLVHNGHIRNTHDLKGAVLGSECQVDSAHVAWSMNTNGEKETLEQLEGAFVFVWWNSKTKLLNIARNTERPLHFVYADKENSMYWASELTQLLHLLKDVDIDEDVGILYPKTMNWYQFDLNNLREFKRIPFVKSQGRQNSRSSNGTSGSGGGGQAGIIPYTDDDMAMWEQLSEGATSKSKMMDPATTLATSSEEELDEIRASVAKGRMNASRQSGIPTSHKRLVRAKMELAKIGISFNALRNCIPKSWKKYKNQRDLGSILAVTQKDGLLVEVLQVTHDQWVQYQKCRNLLVDCVNVRNGPKNAKTVIGVVSPKMATYLERLRGPVLENRENLKALSLGGSIERSLFGPDPLLKISTARFLELVYSGCANCKGTITPPEHMDVIWVGSPPAAICPVCAKDPGILELLGIPEEYRMQRVH